MKKMLTLALMLGLAAGAWADTLTFGWETGTPDLLGMFPDGGITASIATDPVHSGAYSLELSANTSSTEQAFVAWIRGLSNGDVVEASFWCYDTTAGGSPSGRIWAHWNDDPDDVTGYSGSASGNSTYSGDEPWSLLSHSWTVVDGHTGLVIEARYYGAVDPIWIDDLTVTAPSGAVILMPDFSTAVEGSTWSQFKSLY